MTADIFIFDRNLIRLKRNRAASYLKDHGFLIDWAQDQMMVRLADIKRDFSKSLQIGCRSNKNFKGSFGIKDLITIDNSPALKPDIIAEEDLLPITTENFDLIYSALSLHSVNDLPGALAQIKNSLKADGLFMAAMLGGETLYELRYVLQQAELELYSGQSPRVAPFADMPQMGNLMQRAGFNLPVIDSEKITVTYDNIYKLMHDLRYMGEANSTKSRNKKFVSKRFFDRANELYQQLYSDQDNRLIATFDVIFLIGWAPHDSQQKPLRPGSASNRLSDVLKTQEEKLPC